MATARDSLTEGAPAAHHGGESSLFDLQVNGFAGVDFQQPDLAANDLYDAVHALRAHQTERIFLTLITDAPDALAAKFRRLELHRASDPTIAETICGYHLEGPFLSPEEGYRGAHRADLMRAPDIGLFQRWQEAAGGNIRLVTVAPEWPGAPEFIAAARASGVMVSLGHTCASDREISDAISAGATLCTHLGNGVPQMLPRHDNVVQRLLARDELIACLIPDGIHLPPFVFRNLARAKPPGKVFFTTDAMAAAGARDGMYTMGDLRVECRDGIVRAPGALHFAGSSLTPDRGVRNASEWLGLPLADARRCFSSAVAAHFDIALPQISS